MWCRVKMQNVQVEICTCYNCQSGWDRLINIQPPCNTIFAKLIDASLHNDRVTNSVPVADHTSCIFYCRKTGWIFIKTCLLS